MSLSSLFVSTEAGEARKRSVDAGRAGAGRTATSNPRPRVRSGATRRPRSRAARRQNHRQPRSSSGTDRLRTPPRGERRRGGDGKEGWPSGPWSASFCVFPISTTEIEREIEVCTWGDEGSPAATGVGVQRGVGPGARASAAKRRGRTLTRARSLAFCPRSRSWHPPLSKFRPCDGPNRGHRPHLERWGRSPIDGKATLRQA